MNLLDLTLGTPAANLACDEALLDWCEEGQCDGVLRFWESGEYFAVLGYANKAASELNLEGCRRHGIPILRRCSGGGTVLQGPGCLNYSLVLRIEGELQSVTETNCFVMQRNRDALQTLVKEKVEIGGFTDLTRGDRKFSGNAQRRRRHFLLFHGSILLQCDFKLMAQVLNAPSKQPEYRANRTHAEFLAQLALPPDQVKEALQKQWKVSDSLRTVPLRAIEELVRDRYSRADWNLKF